MYLWLFMFVVFLACVAFTWNEGAWNNILTLLMALLSGLFATNYYGSMSYALMYQIGTLGDYTQPATYQWDIICFWLIFGFVFAMLRLNANRLSKFKLRFRKPVEIGTNMLMSCAIASIMVTFFLFTVHIAPLARHPFGGAFQRTPDQGGPSRVWMALSDYWSSSMGPLSNLGTVQRFGPSQDFIEKNYWRRRTLEGEENSLVDMDAPYNPRPE